MPAWGDAYMAKILGKGTSIAYAWWRNLQDMWGSEVQGSKGVKVDAATLHLTVPWYWEYH